MSSEAQKAACRRYYERTKGKHRVFAIRLNKEDDGDVIAAIDRQSNKTAYIKKLVRAENARERIRRCGK